MLDDFLIHVFHKGNTLEAYKVFGAHLETNDHKKGVRVLSTMASYEINNLSGCSIFWNGAAVRAGSYPKPFHPIIL